MAVVFFDALRVKIRDEGVVRSKAMYLALGMLHGWRAATSSGLWIEQTEGAKFWLKVFTDLRARGCEDILIAVTDGLKGMPEALEAAFPQTTLQTCIVHLIRHSLEYASWRDRRAARPWRSRAIYTAPTEEAARAALDAFEASPLGQRFPDGGGRVAPRVGARHPVLCLSAGRSAACSIRRTCSRTSTGSCERSSRRVAMFPTDEAATKLLWLALRNITVKWATEAGKGWPARR